ncbi:hypothetical protein B0H13DRAFT_1899824 [Mycena leptocephala]|nr:hypothetical protein B0H13DRAFT_1899824 [Mycena leptocephala]
MYRIKVGGLCTRASACQLYGASSFYFNRRGSRHWWKEKEKGDVCGKGDMTAGAGAGELHMHRPHAATTMKQSAAGRRAIIISTPVDTTTPGVPAYYAEDVATARALKGPDFSYLLGNEGRWAADGPGQDDNERDGITMATEETPGEVAGATRRGPNFERWDNGGFPMRVFVTEHREETPDEMLKVHCGHALPVAHMLEARNGGRAEG